LGDKAVFWVQRDCLILNIVFAWEQAVSRTTAREEGKIASHRFPMYKPDSDVVDLDYLTYFFKSTRGKHLLMLASPGGAGRNKTLGKNEFEDIAIQLPPLAEQKTIASYLSQWDHGLHLTTELLAAKKSCRSALMQYLLTGKKRFPRFSTVWQEVHLGDVFTERTENNLPDLPLLSITGENGVVLRTQIERKDSSNKDKSKYLRICPGDIGYNTMRMWQGVSGLSRMEGIISPAYTVITPNPSIDGEFMAVLFKFTPVIHLFRRYSQGLVDDTLNLKFSNFAKIKVNIPKKEEQVAIAAVFRLIDREIGLLREQLVALHEQRKSLLQQLLSGKRRVNTSVAA